MNNFIKNTVILTILVFGFSTTIISQNTPTKHTVLIKKMKFIPEVLNVKKGDTVVWINNDFYPHDVSKYDDNAWHSSPLDKGESWSKVVTETEEYYCSLHVVMRGKIIVDK